MTPPCEANPSMAAMKKSNEAKFKAICTGIRTDGAFVEAGENDNLIVQKLAANPGRTTGCTKIRIPSNVVNSFIYSSDGIDNGTCTLQLYKSESCRDRDPITYDVTQDISGCNSETFRAVKLQC